MRIIDADALIEKCGDWYVEEGTESGFIGTLKNLLATMPTIQPEKAKLSQQGTTKDTISRQAAIDALDVLCQEHRYRIPGKRETYSEYNEAWQDALDRAEGLIFNLPPAQSEPQEGHWIEGKIYRDVIECNCSECGQLMTTAASVRMNYCPNCGAKMKGATT